MSEPTPRLNLIQRAMQQANLRRAASAEELPEIAEERCEPAMELRERPVERHEVPADRGEAPVARIETVVERPAVVAPKRSVYADVGAPARTVAPGAAHGVRLNMNKLRESRMVTPDNRASVTYNEFRSIKRKLREMHVAFELERNFSKDRILELYLNQINLGNGANGIEAAAQRYFGKSARTVTLSESASRLEMALELI